MTAEEHKPLPVSGYQPQSDAKVALVNRNKREEEQLLRYLDNLRGPVEVSETFEGQTRVLRIVTGPAIEGESFTVDQRWLAVARSHFEQGYMALNRAVFQPQRIKLPEDGE